VKAPPASALDFPLISQVRDPLLAGLAISLLLLALSYALARVISFVVGRLLLRAARPPADYADKALVRSVKRPLTWAVFLLGATIAVDLFPLPDAVSGWLVRLAFASCLVMAAVASIRILRLLLLWWARPGSAGGGEKPWAQDLSPLFSKLGSVVVGLLALISVLKTFGVDVSSMIVSLGVGSLAVGLAAQDTLANMFAGFTLLLDRPFRLGDRIQITSGEVGDVGAIGLRATRIETPDETVLIIPNSVLTKDKVVNLTFPTRALTTRLDLPVAYGTDLPEVKRILVAAALASPRVEATRTPLVLVTRLGESSVLLRLVFWVRDYTEQGLCTSEVYEEIYRRLAEAGIEIPLPAHRVVQEVASRSAD
jgi:MscS family membrane protein